MSEVPASAELIGILVRLRTALDEHPLPFEAADADDARAERLAVVQQLDDYIVPRLVQIDAPLLAVVGGSTGAGKSTLVNSLVGAKVTQSGVLRPTTRSPVLVHNPGDSHWFGTDRLLPELLRTQQVTNDQSSLQLVATELLPAGIAILDAPDVDSVEQRNRELAAQLLAAADLWLFVTSAARYADQVPWDFLAAAAERSTAVAVVLDRTTPAAVREVSSHLARMLRARGLADAPLFTVPESTVDVEGLLPPEAVAQIRGWLDRLAADSSARSQVVRKTLDGALSVLGHRVRTVAAALRTQEQIADQLRNDVESTYADALASLDEATQDGTLLKGEVLARWQEFVGTGEFMRGLEDRVSRVRDRLTRRRGEVQPGQRLAVAVESGLETLIVEYAESAAERAALAWRSLPAGGQLLTSAPNDISRTSREFRGRAAQTVRDWQTGVLELVRTEGSDRRATARFLAYGVNALGVVLMIAVFSQTAGLTGAEVGVAGGTALVGQRLLEAVFGDQAVRRLVEQARRDLSHRVEHDLLEPEQRRFLALLESVPVPPGGSRRILELSREVESVRWQAAQAAGPPGAIRSRVGQPEVTTA